MRPPARPRRPARDLALIASFAALIAVLGLPGALTPFGIAVPITLQTLGVMLAGAVLGARRGALAVVTFLALTAAGLPLLAGGRGGVAVFVGPSAGYLVGFVAGAFVIGWLTERRLPDYPRWWGAVCTVVGGIVVVYLFGVPVQAAVLHTELVGTVVAAAAYLPGDAIKVVVTVAVASAVHRGYPAISERQRAREDSLPG